MRRACSLAALALALAAGGCHGDGSRDRYRADGNRICRSLFAELERIGPPVLPQDRGRLRDARVRRRVAEVGRRSERASNRALGELRALRPPHDFVDEHAALFAAIARYRATATRLQRALRGDGGDVEQLLTRQRAGERAVNDLFREVGWTRCARDG